MVGVVTLLFALLVNYYASTPEAATRLVLYTTNGSALVIERVNVVGRYATVLARNGMMEGSAEHVPILLQHFSFGWQPLESLDFRCRLDGHTLSPHDEDLLMRGMPKPQDDRPCSDDSRHDIGSPAVIEALRRQMGPLVPYVVIVGDYAVGEWYGAGGGQTLFRRRAGRWRAIAGGGGALGFPEMREYGVPRTSWCALVFDPTCKDHPSGR